VTAVTYYVLQRYQVTDFL